MAVRLQIMSSAEQSPQRAVPHPGTAVASGTPPARVEAPEGEESGVAAAGAQPDARAADPGSTNGQTPASGARTAPAALTDTTTRMLRRAGAAADEGWRRSVPKARWLTGKVAPLSRRASQVDLVEAAAGVAVTALAAVVIALAAQVEWQVGVLSAPLWLFVGAALLAGTVLGPWRGLLAVVLYLVLGLVGAAASADGTGIHLDGPWAGVLLSLPVAVTITGAISAAHASLRSPVTSKWYFFGWFFAAALVGVAVVYAGGLWTLFERADVDGWAVFATMSGRFPFDVLQCLAVAAIATAVRRLVPGLLRQRRRRPGNPRRP